MKKVIKKVLKPLYKLVKNGCIGEHYKKSLTPSFTFDAVNNRLVCRAEKMSKCKYIIILNGKKYRLGKKGAKIALNNTTVKAIKNGNFEATAWKCHMLFKYKGEDCQVEITDKRIIKLDGKKYKFSNDKYLNIELKRSGSDLKIDTRLFNASENTPELKLFVADKKYNIVKELEVKNNEAIINNIDELVADNSLLRLIFIGDDKVLKAVVKPFDDDGVQATLFYDFVNLKKKLWDYEYTVNRLDYPIPPLKKNYKRLKEVKFDPSNNTLVLKFKKKYKDCKVRGYLRSLKTNERELIKEFNLKKTVKIDNLDEVLNREINYIDRYILEYEVINANGKVVDTNWLKIKQKKTRDVDDYILMSAHGNRLGFFDREILVIENEENHFTYHDEYNFNLENSTYTTDFEVKYSAGRVFLDLEIYSLLSKIRSFNIYLEDKYMNNRFSIYEERLDEPTKVVKTEVPLDLDKIEDNLYYNARLNFKIGVEYVDDYRETGFLIKKLGKYSVEDRYLLKKEMDNDLVMAFYIGGNIYNLNVWHTSNDEYEKGVKFQAGREKYFETLKNEEIDENLIFFEANLGKNYTGNPKYLYEYMISHDEYKDFKFVWSYPSDKEANIPGGPITVERGTEDYYYYLAKAKYWVNNILFPVKEKRTDTVYLQTWHGTPLKKLGFDIECEGPEKQAFGNLHKESLNWDYFLTDNDYGEEKLVNAFRFKKNVIKKGYPINDIYYVDELKNRAIEKLHKEYPVTEQKKVILYAPTWRDLQGDYVRGYDFELPFDVDELYERFGDEYVILVKLHHLIADSLEIDEKYKDFLINVSDKEDIMELLCVTDVLITDYSSVFYDFASAKKPMLFYMYDLDEYINETRGLYVGVETLPGPILKNNKELIDALENIDKYNYENSKKLKAFCEDMAKYCHGTSCKDVLDIVIKER